MAVGGKATRESGAKAIGSLPSAMIETGCSSRTPSLHAVRGFLKYVELEERWHDVGPKKEHIEY